MSEQSPFGGATDPLFDQAVALVVEHRRASISLVQRHLRIGYNRASYMLEAMEKQGLIRVNPTPSGSQYVMAASLGGATGGALKAGGTATSKPGLQVDAKAGGTEGEQR